MSKLQIVNEIHFPVRKNFPRRHVIVKGLYDTFQADLIEMKQYSKENNRFKYILTVIDIFSKFAWARAVQSKTGEEVTRAMKSIFDSCLRIPKNMHTDQGKEFYNKYFSALMNEHKINHYSTFSSLKAQIVERFNRTLMNKIWRLFSFNGSYKWIHILPSVIDDYNNTKHRTIGLKPIEVSENNANNLLDTVYKKRLRMSTSTDAKYQVNDFVRISKYKSIFEKGYTPNWSTEIFKIYKVQLTSPLTYLLEDMQQNKIKGCFYEQEIQKAMFPDVYLVEKILKFRKNEVFVKWLGFDSSYNSWIDKNDLI